MRFSSSLIIDFVWSVVAGTVMAISVIPLNIAAFVIWLLLLIWRSRRLGKARVVLCQCGVLFAIVVSAAVAPVKITEQCLGSRVSLDEKQMSLQQLDAYVASPEKRGRFPIRIALTFAEEDKDNIVRWPSEQMTLGEFIAALESETALRHRFQHCGNGWTLLWGGDCCFGLSIRDPQLIGPPPYPRKRYEGRSW